MPQLRTWVLIRLMPGLPKGAKNVYKAWHNLVETVQSQLMHIDITGPGLKWDCTDGFQRQCYPLMAARVRDDPEQVMVAEVLYGAYMISSIAKGVPMG